MFTDDFSEKLDRFTRGIVRQKVAQLIGRAGFTKQDRDDLTQQFYLRVLQSLKAFDPAKAHRNVFITTVVERFFATLLRDKQAKKRDYRRITSLNLVIDVTGAGPTELAHTISHRELNARRGVSPRSDEELARLRYKLAEVVAELPADLADLAGRMKTQTVSEIARDKGVPRTTIIYWVRRLRQRFEQAELQDYL